MSVRPPSRAEGLRCRELLAENPSELEAGPSLLVVDDDEIYRERVARALRARGCQVRTARNAAEALVLAREESPECAVLDLRMPGASGLELLTELKSLDPSTRILILTGYGSIATALEAVHLGAVNYLTKPVDADQILGAFGPSAPPVETAEGGKGETFASRAGRRSPACGTEDNTPSLARVEWEHIQRVLSDCCGNLSEAARRLGMHRRSLQRKANRKRPSR